MDRYNALKLLEIPVKLALTVNPRAFLLYFGLSYDIFHFNFWNYLKFCVDNPNL